MYAYKKPFFLFFYKKKKLKSNQNLHLLNFKLIIFGTNQN